MKDLVGGILSSEPELPHWHRTNAVPKRAFLCLVC